MWFKEIFLVKNSSKISFKRFFTKKFFKKCHRIWIFNFSRKLPITSYWILLLTEIIIQMWFKEIFLVKNSSNIIFKRFFTKRFVKSCQKIWIFNFSRKLPITSYWIFNLAEIVIQIGFKEIFWWKIVQKLVLSDFSPKFSYFVK